MPFCPPARMFHNRSDGGAWYPSSKPTLGTLHPGSDALTHTPLGSCWRKAPIGCSGSQQCFPPQHHANAVTSCHWQQCVKSGSGFSVLERKSSTGFQCRLWGASKTYFSFYRLFPWCTEVPIANSAAAELQKITQPGYNPVAGCPIHPQSKIQWLNTVTKQRCRVPL